MSENPSQNSKKFLTLLLIVLAALVVIGIAWAISSGSSNGDTVDSSVFNDADSPMIGAENGELVVHVFEDFQCPACRSAEVGFRHAVEKYGDRVTFVWKDFPLQSIHQNALNGANAARCAQEQGKFWEYHDRLYDDQSAWSDLSDPTQKFKDYANALSMDVDAWSSCFDERRYQGNVLRDVREAQDLRLTGTPTVFIGDTVISRVMSVSEWDQLIEAALTSE